MKTPFRILTAAVALNALSVASYAVPTSYTSLLRGGEIRIGDKIFGDFRMQSAAVDVRSATIEATIGPSGIYYLTFRGPFVSSGVPSDVSIFYSVRTASGQPLITAIDQAFNYTSSGAGGFILIGETVRKESFTGPAVAQSSLAYVTGFLDDLADPSPEPVTGDQLFVNPPQAKLYVTKDVYFAAMPGGVIGPTEVIQSFHQISLPDGGLTVGLMGIGIAGLGMLRFRRGE